jgi:hypothetical protein
MAMVQIKTNPMKHRASASKVRSIREVTKTSRRIQPRRELPESLLDEFVKAINDACESGELPYKNYRLDQHGSPNKVHAHYMADTLFPVHLEMARKISLRDKISIDEAVNIITEKQVDKRKAGLAFILTVDARKFWYHVEHKILYHDMEKKSQLSPEDKETIARLRKLLTPGNEYKLLNELGKV